MTRKSGVHAPYPSEHPQSALPITARKSLRFDLPIAQRLTVGFLVAALIAGIITGCVGILDWQSLRQQSDFYQQLLKARTELIMGESDLKLMNSTMHELLAQAQPDQPIHSEETLRDGKLALRNLESNYDALLRDYVGQNYLVRHPDQANLLQDSAHRPQILLQQSALVDSATRTWRVSRAAQDHVLNTLLNGNVSQALTEERLQAELTLADAQSADRALIHFTTVLADAEKNVVDVEEQKQLWTTIAGACLAFLGIVLCGLLISNTLVSRVKQLRSLTRSVEAGKIDDRIKVVGHDELGDISAAVNAMLETIVLNQEAVTASELKDQFIASVSHELRNPLTEVYGWLEILDSYQSQLDPATQSRFLKRAMHGCQELMLLITNVLDATHVDRPAQALQQEQIAVAQVVQSVVEHISPRELEAYHVQMHVPEQLVARADIQYVRQILRNLLSNAFKYTPKGSAITISAQHLMHSGQLESEDAMICICVKDSGPGIPPAEAATLFQRYARLQRDKDRGIRGTGLGLYICRQLVEAMGGKIWVESSGVPGDGSRFCFTLAEASSILPLPEEQDAPISYAEAL